MKVGTDGLLLGAWASAPQVRQVLDIGTGTGLLALMVAQRYPQAQITAIDLDPAACTQAQENVARSPWANRIQIYPGSLHSFVERHQREFPVPAKSFDLLICNPPFYSSASPEMPQSRRWARENDYLPLESLCAAATQLLAPQGCLAVIYPLTIAKALLSQLSGYGLTCAERITVYPTPGQPAKRMLMAIARHHSEPITAPQSRQLIIEQRRHHYTADYCQLLAEFLLCC
jgi:tRNA1Val (adenine37-N6)-methyltransferase